MEEYSTLIPAVNSETILGIVYQELNMSSLYFCSRSVITACTTTRRFFSTRFLSQVWPYGSRSSSQFVEYSPGDRGDYSATNLPSSSPHSAPSQHRSPRDLPGKFPTMRWWNNCRRFHGFCRWWMHAILLQFEKMKWTQYMFPLQSCHSKWIRDLIHPLQKVQRIIDLSLFSCSEQ